MKQETQKLTNSKYSMLLDSTKIFKIGSNTIFLCTIYPSKQRAKLTLDHNFQKNKISRKYFNLRTNLDQYE